MRVKSHIPAKQSRLLGAGERRPVQRAPGVRLRGLSSLSFLREWSGKCSWCGVSNRRSLQFAVLPPRRDQCKERDTVDRGRAVGSRSPHFPRARCCSGHSGHFMASKMETLKTGQREDFLKILNVVSNFFETTWLTIPELSTGRTSRLLGTATCPPPPREGRHCGGRLSQCRRRPEVDQDTDEKIQRLSRTGECGPAMFNKVEGLSLIHISEPTRLS